jgi:hypothetical protein
MKDGYTVRTEAPPLCNSNIPKSNLPQKGIEEVGLDDKG